MSELVSVVRAARIAVVAVAAVLACGASACARSNDVRLLRLDGLSTPAVERGAAFEVRGRGFPVGRTGTVELEGDAHLPGERPRGVRVEASALAISPETVAVSVDDRAFDAIGGRATFRGTVRVRFASEGTSAISGVREGVVLDFLPTTRERLEHHFGDAQRGRSIATRLGLVLEDEETEEGGLVIARVEPGTVADRMGLTAGDRLLALDGLRLYTLADLLPEPGMKRAELEVARGDDATPVKLTVPLFVASDAPSAFGVGMALAFFALALVFLFAAPSARLTSWLARTPPHDREATLVWLFGEETAATTRRGRIRQHAVVALGVAFASACFAGVAIVAHSFSRSFGVGILLTTSLALRLTARLFADGREESVELLPFFVAGTPLTMAVTSIALLVGTGHLEEVHHAQGGLPWEWLVFRNPIAFALFPVFAATALGRVEPVGTTNGVAKVAARGHLLVVSTLGAALFLGGWNPPFPAAPHAMGFGVALYVVKCFCLLAMGLWARSVSPGSGADTWRWAVPVATLGLLATTAWLVVGVPHAVEALSGPLLTTIAAIVGVYLLFARVRKAEPILVVSPFL